MPKKIKVNGKSIQYVLSVVNVTRFKAQKITGVSKATMSRVLSEEEIYIHEETYKRLTKLFNFAIKADGNIRICKSVRLHALDIKPRFTKQESSQQDVVNKQLQEHIRQQNIKSFIIYFLLACVIIAFGLSEFWG